VFLLLVPLLACDGEGETAEPADSGGYDALYVGGYGACARDGPRYECQFLRAGVDYAQLGLPAEQGFDSLVLSAYVTCALTAGVPYCWGNTAFGATDAPSTKFTQVGLGEHHGCGLDEQGEVTCWGTDHAGETRPGEGPFTTLAVYTNDTCTIDPSGLLACSGAFNAAYPPTVPLAGPWVMVSGGGGAACVLDPGGQPSCWGAHEAVNLPPALARVKSLAVASGAACALRSDDTLQCWGSDTPSLSPPAGTFRSLGAGGGFFCALSTAGKISCWGCDEGSVGECEWGVIPGNVVDMSDLGETKYP